MPQSATLERLYDEAYDKVLEPWRSKALGYGEVEATLAHQAGLKAVAEAALSETREHPAEKAIREHNAECLTLCNERKDCWGKDYKRHCSDCPRAWTIEYSPLNATGAK